MPSLVDILSQLQSQAQPRQDLGGGQPYTFSGRVGYAGQPTSVTEMLTRQPTESPDAEGLGAAASLAAGQLMLPKWKPYLNLGKEPVKGFYELNYPYILNVRVTDPITGEMWDDAVKGLNRGHAAAVARSNWWGYPIEFLDKPKK